MVHSKVRRAKCPSCGSIDTELMTSTSFRLCFGCSKCLHIWFVDKSKMSEQKFVFLTGRF